LLPVIYDLGIIVGVAGTARSPAVDIVFCVLLVSRDAAPGWRRPKDRPGIPTGPL